MDPLTYVFSLEQFGIKFGLENIRALVARLGHPERAFRSAHVAGTNGKGSVTAMVDAALRLAGHRSARYTSPHLIELNERYVIDGCPVATPALVEAAARVRDTIEAMVASGELEVHPTYFEATTAIGFELFRHAGVDVAAIEVGLGGRLDATNVISPMVTAVTSIAFDHEQYLGRTLAGIAAEKAGILKPDVPVVLGPLAPEARDVIVRRARDLHAPVTIATDAVDADRDPKSGRVRLRTPLRDYGDVSLALRGAHQAANAAVAVCVLERLDAQGLGVPRDAVVRALETVSWPGRLDVRRFPDGREAILDAAHNGEGAAALAAYLGAEADPPLPIVFAAMRDKDVPTMFRALLPSASVLVVTEPATPRAAHPEALAAEARRVRPDLEVVVEPSVASAVAAAWRRSRRIVIAGSIFLLGEVYREFGGL